MYEINGTITIDVSALFDGDAEEWIEYLEECVDGINVKEWNLTSEEIDEEDM